MGQGVSAGNAGMAPRKPLHHGHTNELVVREHAQ